MTDPSGFSVKEIVIDTNRKLDKFIDKVEDYIDESDKRFDAIEQKDAKMEGSFKTILWIVGFLGVGGLGAIVRIFLL